MHPTPAQPYDGTHDREIESLAEFDEVVSTRGTLSPLPRPGRLPDGAYGRPARRGHRGRRPPRLPDGSGRGDEGAYVGRPGPPAGTRPPFDPYRGFVHTPDELFAPLDEGYDATPDALTYRWFRQTAEEWSAEERSMEGRIALVDRIEEAPDALKRLSG